MMGLLSSRLDLDNQKYILVLHALELLANETNDHLQTVAGFLLSNDFDVDCPTYRKRDTGAMVFADDGYGGTFQKTWEILKYFHTTSPHHFYESGYRENYWLRSEFFSFLIEHKITNIPSVIDWIAKNPTDTQAGEIEQQTAILQRDPLLTNLDIFSIVEASCLISGDNPIQVNICSNDTNFWQNYDEYLKAEKLISAGIKSGNLDHDITRQSLQNFLKIKGYIIKGFNDNLPTLPTPQNDNQLSQQLADLNAQLEQARAENERLKSHTNKYRDIGNGILFMFQDEAKNSENQKITIERQAKEIAELKAQLESIERADNDTQSNTPAEKILHPRTANNASKIISALASELLGMDLTQPYADNTNGRILKAIERQGNTLSKDTIADWLRQAHEISK